jgi:hypothetical protein
MLGFKRFETAAVTIRGIELASKSRNNSATSNHFKRLGGRFAPKNSPLFESS